MVKSQVKNRFRRDIFPKFCADEIVKTIEWDEERGYKTTCPQSAMVGASKFQLTFLGYW